MVFDSDTMVVKAITSVEEGQELTISYVELAATSTARKRELVSHYFFACRCEACVPPVTSSHALLSLLLDSH